MIVRPPHCENCPFKWSKTVGPRGNPEAPIVLVGESPGSEEKRKGIPYVGKSGTVLWTAVPEGVKWADTHCFTTNAFQCVPPAKKKGPQDPRIIAATHACHDRLMGEIAAHPRQIVIAMGNPAVWSLTGNFSTKITQIRGKLIGPSSELQSEKGILPCIHPAALLRGTGTFRHFRQDIEYGIDLAQNQREPKKPIRWRTIVCDNAKKIREAVETLTTKKYIAADTETTGFNPRTDKILALGVAATPGKVYIFPGDTLRDKRYRFLFSRLFKAPKPRWIWHNGKFDMGFMRAIPAGRYARCNEDTMLLSYCWNERPGYHDLEQVAQDLLGAEDYKDKVAPHVKTKEDSFENVPTDILYQWRLAPDVSYTLQVFRILRPKIQRDIALEKLYTETLIPASEFLYQVERNGLHVDRQGVKRLKAKLEAEVEAAEEKLLKAANQNFNPNSPPQVMKILFEDLGLPTKYGRSSGKAILEKLPQVPFVVALREYRKRQKMLSTYITGKKQGVIHRIESDGKVHSTFKLHNSLTGRLTSSGPNIQNIPREPEYRSMFGLTGSLAEKFVLLEADYNQAELRCLACLSGDVWLCDLYRSTDRSLHNEMAEYFFGPDFDHEGKMAAKMVNFGIVYGRTGSSIAQQFQKPTTWGDSLVTGWFERCPQAKEYIDKCRATPLLAQQMVTPFGRKKRVGIVTRDNLWALQNEAANFPNQSIASDFTLTAGIRLEPILKRMNVKIVNIVHDSLLMLVPKSEFIIQRTKQLVRETMEGIPEGMGMPFTRVPFKVDFKQGTHWGHLEELKEAA